MTILAKSAAHDDISDHQRLYTILCALGFAARERVSINTRAPGGRFMSELYEARELVRWVPPQDRDVWFGVNPVGRHVTRGRGAEADIARVRTLFADLDIKPGKQFDSMAQCEEAARRLAVRLGAVPVALIQSGHGLQPLWRIASPPGDSNVIDRDRSRDDWKLAYARWGSMVQDAARDVMWSPDGSQTMRTVDNIYELSRVLRCPGSVNWKKPDAPVLVRTELLPCPGRVGGAGLVKALDRANVGPLAAVRSVGARVATSLAEADSWLTEQVGADLDAAELRELPRSRALWQYLSTAALVDVLDDPNGAHQAMNAKVLHAVLSAQEGKAGLVLALNNIGAAYVELMDARERGDRLGDARPVAVAEDDVRRAVVGAVARARARGKPVVPNVDAWGPGSAASQPVRGGWRSWPRRPRQPRKARIA